MKIIALGDTHFGFKSGNTSFARTQMIKSSITMFEQVLEKAKEINADAVIHTGDVFDRSKPPKMIVKKITQILEDFLDLGIPLLIIPGNHDRANLPWTLLDYFNKDFHLFNQAKLVNIADTSFFGFPFEYTSPRQIHNYGSKKLGLKNKLGFIICHQLFSEASFGPHKFTFKNQEDVIQVNESTHGNIISITGHIHRAQVLSNGKVIYTGSTERTSFMEAIEPKGFIEINIEEDFHNIKFHKLPSLFMHVQEFRGSSAFTDTLDYLYRIRDFPEIKRTRYLVRLTDTKLNKMQISAIWSLSNQLHIPYFNFRPKLEDHVLEPLYTPEVYNFSLNQKIILKRGSRINIR